jgi:hypothetical protein
MNNINLLKDKDVNCFIIYFYFALPLYLLSLWFSWGFGDVYYFKEYNILWQFDEVLYAYLAWPFFSLLNLSYITIKNNKVKLCFSILLIIFISLISTYFILNIENIYKINFPEQFSSLYVNSIIFVTTVISVFILFAIILFRNGFNKHNFILINSYFFLIILFISMLFIVINKPKYPLASGYAYLPSVIMSFYVGLFFLFYVGLLFLFIPFLNFLFLILIHFFKKHKIVPIIIITIIAFWDMWVVLITGLLSPLGAFLHFILYFVLSAMVFTSLVLGMGIHLDSYKERNDSPIQTVCLFNLIALLIYLGLFSGEFAPPIIDFPVIPVPLYKLGPVYDLASSIIIIILFLMLVKLAIYLRARLK